MKIEIPTVRAGSGGSSYVGSSGAKERLLAEKGNPVVTVDWQRALFFNFVIEPDIVRGQIPSCFELELYRGRACVSLVALTKRNFRAHPNGAWYGNALRLLREQKFLNLRIYVRHQGESGVFFKWGWLSRPLGLPLPDEPLGLTCAFVDANYSHIAAEGCISGSVQGKSGTFAYSGIVNAETSVPCAPGSLAEFAMERYSGFFWHHGEGRVFRAWHEPWLSMEIKPLIKEKSLITNRFPWFAEARLVEARLCADCKDVWLGRAHRFEHSQVSPHHRTTAFFEMP